MRLSASHLTNENGHDAEEPQAYRMKIHLFLSGDPELVGSPLEYTSWWFRLSFLSGIVPVSSMVKDTVKHFPAVMIDEFNLEITCTFMTDRIPLYSTIRNSSTPGRAGVNP